MRKQMAFKVTTEIKRADIKRAENGTLESNTMRELIISGYDRVKVIYNDNYIAGNKYDNVAILTDEGDCITLRDDDVNKSTKQHKWISPISKLPKEERWLAARYEAIASLARNVNPHVQKTPITEFEPNDFHQHIVEFYQAALELFDMELLLCMHNVSAAHIDGIVPSFNKKDIAKKLIDYGNAIIYTPTAYKMQEDNEGKLILPDSHRMWNFKRAAQIYSITINAINHTYNSFPFIADLYPIDTDWDFYDLTIADNDYVEAIVYMSVKL